MPEGRDEDMDRQQQQKAGLQVPKQEFTEDKKATTSQSQTEDRVGWATANGGDKKLERKEGSRLFIEGLEARFKERCEVSLCLDDKTLQQALQLFRDSKPLLLANIGTIGTGTIEETERLWNACVLYAVKRLTTGTSIGGERLEDGAAGFTLSQLLRVTKLSVVEFFKELPQFLAKAGPTLRTLYGDDWEKRLQVTEVQANFVHLMVLYNYYKRVYQDFFLSPENFSKSENGSSSGASGDLSLPIHMRFGWMLFLAMRMHVLNRFTDLVTCTNGLLAVIIVLILHMPSSLRKYLFEDSVKFVCRSSQGVNVVASLCNLYHASEEDVSRMVEKTNSMIRDLFQNTSNGAGTHSHAQPFPAMPSHAQQVVGVNTAGLAYFEGLMEDRSIASNLRIVEKDYEEAYHSRGELDERMFINGDDSMIGAVSSGTPNMSGSKRKYDIMSSPVRGAVSTAASPLSPCNSPCSSPVKAGGPLASNSSKMPPPTPVSITMTTAKWLRTVIAPLPAEPSSELQLFFRSCDRDISSDVRHRAQVLLEAIFPTVGAGNWRCMRGSSMMDSIWAEQRRLEAMKLYYRVVEAMCRAEAQRLHCNNLTALLSNERFHRCMIACSAELVLATHKTVTMTFPAVLEPTGITAFDLSKVIESFVRHEDTLPRELKRHLNSIEERLLESMAWDKGSSMYNSLVVAKPSLATEINRLGLMADPMPSLDNLGSCSRPSLASMQRLAGTIKAEGAAGEVSGAPSSPQRPVAASPAQNNGSDTGTGSLGIADQVGPACLMSPVKERPSAFSAFSSPLRNRVRAPLQSAFASPHRPSPLGGGETCAETVINVFFQKVLKLAAVRIRNLCERLRQSNPIMEQVYRVMQHALYHETSLFFNRHIDQLILCSIYGVCKVSRVNVTFRDIVYQYRKQPQCKSHVFRNVFIDLPPVRRAGKAGGQESGDIIKFYNDVFVPSTKAFLLQVGSIAAPCAPSNARACDEGDTADGQAPGSPVPSTFPVLPDMSPKKVSATHNVYVSPLRSIKVDSLMSPHTRSLYACVGESTHAYQSPSKDLTAINNRLNSRRLGRLDFGEAALVSDSMVANTLHQCNNNSNHQSAHLTADSVLSLSQPWSAPSCLKRPRPDR